MVLGLGVRLFGGDPFSFFDSFTRLLFVVLVSFGEGSLGVRLGVVGECLD